MGLEQLAALHGLRVLSLVWIIYGYTHAYVPPLLKNPEYVTRFVSTQASFQFVANSTLAADVFLVLGGFLCALVLTRLLDSYKSMGWRTLGYFYLQRVLRITPVLVVVLLFYWKVSPFTGSGPLWFGYRDMVRRTCDQYWWSSLLFVSNFYPPTQREACMPWTWYLSLDMQLLVLSPLIVYPLYRWPKAGKAAVMALMALSCGAVAYLVLAEDIHVGVGWCLLDWIFQCLSSCELPLFTLKLLSVFSCSRGPPCLPGEQPALHLQRHQHLRPALQPRHHLHQALHTPGALPGQWPLRSICSMSYLKNYRNATLHCLCM